MDMRHPCTALVALYASQYPLTRVVKVLKRTNSIWVWELERGCLLNLTLSELEYLMSACYHLPSYEARKGFLTASTQAKMNWLIHQKRVFVNQCFRINCIVESDSASIVHIINEKCELRRYEVQILPEQVFQISETSSNGDLFSNTICTHASRFDSPDTIACISDQHLKILKYDGNALPCVIDSIGTFGYTLLKSIELGNKYRFSQFAREPVRSYFLKPDDYCRRKTVLLFNKDTVISAPRILDSNNLSPFYKLHHQSLITAVGVASAFEESRNISIYIAKGNRFSLLPLKATRRKTGLIDFMEASNKSKIFHLQCLLSPNNDRKGVLLRRRDGQIEFWDDRQPKWPAVVYQGSLISSNAPQGGHPVVDFPQQFYVAASVGDQKVIRLWKLQTGELMNVLEGPKHMHLDSFPYPPILTFRSFWGVSHQAISKRLKQLGMILQNEGYWIETKRCGATFACEQLVERQTRKGFLHRIVTRDDSCHKWHDNVKPPHVAKVVKKYLETLKWEILPHLPYSPDVAPSDFHLNHPADQQFSSYEEVKNWIDSWIVSKDVKCFRRRIHLLSERWAKVAANDGQYFKT
nr:Mariner Mos1 transposase [Hymenolepis microstoma]